jgi:ribonuclease HI
MTGFHRYDDTIACSDSQFLLTNIDSQNPDTQDVRKLLDTLHSETYLYWIPGHFKFNIPGNEYADRTAKKAAKLQDLESHLIPISFEVAKAHSKDQDPQHHIICKTYKGYQ